MHAETHTDPDRQLTAKVNGPTVGTLTDPFRHVWYDHESEPERSFLVVLASNPNVLRIEVQRKVVFKLDGRKCVHFIDFIVTWKGGKKVAFAVKDTAKSIAESNLDEVLNAISEQHGTTYADEYKTMAGETLNEASVLNGELILACGGDLDHQAQHRVRDILPGLPGVVTLDMVMAASGLGERGMWAAIALIQSGILMNPAGVRITLDLPLRNRATSNGAGNQ